MKKILTVLLIISLMMSFTVTTAFAADHSSKITASTSLTVTTTRKSPMTPFKKIAKAIDSQMASPSAAPFKKMATIMEKYKEQMELRRAEFEEVRLTAKELRQQTKEELAIHRQEVHGYMEQLHKIAQDFKSMTKEERIAAKDDMKALIQQVRDAHKYKLQIISTTKSEIRKLFSEVIHHGVPSEDTINSVTPVLDEL